QNGETIGWDEIGKLDPLYSNEEMEWRIRNPKDCAIYGLLVKESTVDAFQIWEWKQKLAQDNDDRHLCRDVFELEQILGKKNNTSTPLSFVKGLFSF
ncbi:hypothetical protein RFI_01716, partial [Reticulomyxa filosa]